MDYYYVLTERRLDVAERADLASVLRRLGLMRYASGVMWLLQTVFGMKDEYLLCPPNREEGEFILDGVMIGGNMGRGYEKKPASGSRFSSFVSSTFRYFCRSFRRYPIEAISYPIWTVYHFIWKRIWWLRHGTSFK